MKHKGLWMTFACLLLICTNAIPTPACGSSDYLVRDNTGTTRVLLTLTGDCVLGGEEKARKSERSFDSVIAGKGMEWPFSGLNEIFSRDDITLVNLEGVLQDHTKGRLTTKQYTFRGTAAYTKVLQLGSVEQVNIANNHYIDYGKTGRDSTREALSAAGIPFSGFQELSVAEIRGRKIGFGGIRETVYRQDKKIMTRDIEKLKEMGCDAIVYSCHFGKEYSRTHNALQEKMARQAIDLGANLVVGHHPHVVQGVESYNGGVILYSLGNFVFGGNLDLTEFDGCVAQAEFIWKEEEYEGVQIRLIPVLTTGAAPDNDFRPGLAKGEDKDRILQKMQEDSVIPLSETMYFPAQNKISAEDEK